MRTDAVLMLIDAPRLSNEAAREVVEFLYELTSAIENRYWVQLQLESTPTLTVIEPVAHQEHQMDLFDGTELGSDYF